jgi:hypothetical protein
MKCYTKLNLVKPIVLMTIRTFYNHTLVPDALRKLHVQYKLYQI